MPSDFINHFSCSPLQNVLQKFVNDFVDSVFNVSLHNSPQGSSGVYANLGTVSVPPAIKYLFDFLDQEAINHNVHHPNILHVWKCNRLAPTLVYCCVCTCLQLVKYIDWSILVP